MSRKTVECVFIGQTLVEPVYRADDTCLANGGQDMNNCCFTVAQQLILNGKQEIVMQALRGLLDESRIAATRRTALANALGQNQT